MIIGHRGFPVQYPENTMVSFEGAIAAGVGMIELDITLSRDSEIIVIHDDTLDRTTNGSGLVENHTLAMLRNLDAGGWFLEKFAGQKIPTLDDVLDAFLDRVLINIEIKPNLTGSRSYIELIVEKTLTAVNARSANHQVLISSFDAEILKAVVGENHFPAVALLLESPVREEALALAERLGAISIHPDMDILDTETVNKIRARNFLVFPFNMETEKQIYRALEMNVDGFFVDDPLIARMCCQNVNKNIL